MPEFEQRRARPVALTALGLVLVSVGCEAPPPPPVFRVTVEVRSDGAPVPEAEVLLGERSMGRTNTAGLLRMEIPGSEGQQVPVLVRCPTGLRSPQMPFAVRLNSVAVLDRAALLRGITQAADCPPVDRSFGVVVRAAGERPNMPIFWQGREIARTDLAGVAHLAFRAPPSTSIRLELRTENPRLHPQNPAQQWVVTDADDVQVWTQPFEEDPAAPPPRAPRRAPSGPRPGPTRIIRIR